MAIKDIFKVNRKTFFYPSAWIGYSDLKGYTSILTNIIRDLFIPAKPAREETFEQALKRLKLTEENLQSTAKNFWVYCVFFLALSIVSFLMGFYFLFAHGTFAGWLLGMTVTGLFLSQAFRFHFWYFQIKHRKLGCTFAEWRQGKTTEEQEGKGS